MEEEKVGNRTYRFARTTTDVLLVCCSDPSFQTAFRRFVEAELGVKHYIPIIKPGGPYVFGRRQSRGFKVLMEDIEFHVKESVIRRVVIIGHEECRRYKAGYGSGRRVIDKQISDLGQAALSLRSRFPKVRVEGYFAELAGRKIRFKRVAG